MGKNKLVRFAEMQHFPNTFQFPEKMKGQWNDTFFKNDHPIVLELACGRGEYTLGMARMFPEKNFIGVDIKGARLWRGAKTAVEENLKNAAFLRIYIENIAEYFAPGEVSEIWITFPDPHPPAGQAKKRLGSWRFLKEYSRFMQDGGKIHLKTDEKALHDFTAASATSLGLEIEAQSADIKSTHAADPLLNIRTTYELKWLAEGKRISYIRVRMNHRRFMPEEYAAAEKQIKEWLAVHNPPREPV
jgi:tRNA (guanine-N7-)-methyltransferase